MQQFEILSQFVPEVEIKFDHLMPDAMGGLCLGDEIYININRSYYDQVGLLAEEVGHYMTSTGNIVDYTKVDNIRQELRARRKGAQLIIPLERLIACYFDSLQTEYDICLMLEVTPEYFREVIKDYQKQFGSYIEYDGYHIEFEPIYIKELK